MQKAEITDIFVKAQHPTEAVDTKVGRPDLAPLEISGLPNCFINFSQNQGMTGWFSFLLG